MTAQSILPLISIIFHSILSLWLHQSILPLISIICHSILSLWLHKVYYHLFLLYVTVFCPCDCAKHTTTYFYHMSQYSVLVTAQSILPLISIICHSILSLWLHKAYHLFLLYVTAFCPYDCTKYTTTYFYYMSQYSVLMTAQSILPLISIICHSILSLWLNKAYYHLFLLYVTVFCPYDCTKHTTTYFYYMSQYSVLVTAQRILPLISIICHSILSLWLHKVYYQLFLLCVTVFCPYDCTKYTTTYFYYMSQYSVLVTAQSILPLISIICHSILSLWLHKVYYQLFLLCVTVFCPCDCTKYTTTYFYHMSQYSVLMTAQSILPLISIICHSILSLWLHKAYYHLFLSYVTVFCPYDCTKYTTTYFYYMSQYSLLTTAQSILPLISIICHSILSLRLHKAYYHLFLLYVTVFCPYDCTKHTTTYFYYVTVFCPYDCWKHTTTYFYYMSQYSVLVTEQSILPLISIICHSILSLRLHKAYYHLFLLYVTVFCPCDCTKHSTTYFYYMSQYSVLVTAQSILPVVSTMCHSILSLWLHKVYYHLFLSYVTVFCPYDCTKYTTTYFYDMSQYSVLVTAQSILPLISIICHSILSLWLHKVYYHLFLLYVTVFCPYDCTKYTTTYFYYMSQYSVLVTEQSILPLISIICHSILSLWLHKVYYHLFLLYVTVFCPCDWTKHTTTYFYYVTVFCPYDCTKHTTTYFYYMSQYAVLMTAQSILPLISIICHSILSLWLHKVYYHLFLLYVTVFCPYDCTKNTTTYFYYMSQHSVLMTAQSILPLISIICHSILSLRLHKAYYHLFLLYVTVFCPCDCTKHSTTYFYYMSQYSVLVTAQSILPVVSIMCHSILSLWLHKVYYHLFLLYVTVFCPCDCTKHSTTYFYYMSQYSVLVTAQSILPVVSIMCHSILSLWLHKVYYQLFLLCVTVFCPCDCTKYTTTYFYHMSQYSVLMTAQSILPLISIICHSILSLWLHKAYYHLFLSYVTVFCPYDCTKYTTTYFYYMSQYSVLVTEQSILSLISIICHSILSLRLHKAYYHLFLLYVTVFCPCDCTKHSTTYFYYMSQYSVLVTAQSILPVVSIMCHSILSLWLHKVYYHLFLSYVTVFCPYDCTKYTTTYVYDMSQYSVLVTAQSILPLISIICHSILSLWLHKAYYHLFLSYVTVFCPCDCTKYTTTYLYYMSQYSVLMTAQRILPLISIICHSILSLWLHKAYYHLFLLYVTVFCPYDCTKHTTTYFYYMSQYSVLVTAQSILPLISIICHSILSLWLHKVYYQLFLLCVTVFCPYDCTKHSTTYFYYMSQYSVLVTAQSILPLISIICHSILSLWLHKVYYQLFLLCVTVFCPFDCTKYTTSCFYYVSQYSVLVTAQSILPLISIICHSMLSLWLHKAYYHLFLSYVTVFCPYDCTKYTTTYFYYMSQYSVLTTAQSILPLVSIICHSILYLWLH